jgi:uncharacterized RDD family membrane protein YckC
VIKQRATVGERAVYGFVDSLLFLFLWFVVTVCAEVKSPFGFHKRPYTEAHLLKYLEVMLWMTLAFFIGSIIFHRFAGGSPGKLMVGYRTQRVDGSRISWQDALCGRWQCLVSGW